MKTLAALLIAASLLIEAGRVLTQDHFPHVNYQCPWQAETSGDQGASCWR